MVGTSLLVAARSSWSQSWLKLPKRLGQRLDYRDWWHGVDAEVPAAQVVLITTESCLTSQVGRSEKLPRPLRYASVVRQLDVLDKVKADGIFVATSELKLNPDWKLPDR